jgi:hypothetical protein
MEMTIPFAELSGNSLPFHATPQPGEAWGINFNRMESPRGEPSQWTLTGSVFGNYAEPDGPGHNLVYPGPEPGCELIPSMRLASLRDGLEDYEYFALLRKKTATLDPKRDARLLAEIRRELEIEPEIVRSVYEYADDARLIAAKRDRLASLIERAR